MRFLDFVTENWSSVSSQDFILHESTENLIEILESLPVLEKSRGFIELSPGVGKSILSTVLYPAWLWLHCGQSNLRFLCVHGSGHLATLNSKLFNCFMSKLGFIRVRVNSANSVENICGGQRVATRLGLVLGHGCDVLILDNVFPVGRYSSGLEKSSAIAAFHNAAMKVSALGSIVVVESPPGLIRALNESGHGHPASASPD